MVEEGCSQTRTNTVIWQFLYIIQSNSAGLFDINIRFRFCKYINTQPASLVWQKPINKVRVTDRIQNYDSCGLLSTKKLEITQQRIK